MSNHAVATVLTVDDDPIVRADVRLVLEDAGFAVLPSARDGEQAVELAREHSPDVVVLDLALPGIDGVEASRRIREERDVPIVALTGHRGGELVDRASEHVSAYVFKPFAEGGLGGAVTGAIGGAAGQGATAARDESRDAIAQLVTMLGYPASWADELERRSFAEGKVWRFERR